MLFKRTFSLFQIFLQFILFCAIGSIYGYSQSQLQIYDTAFSYGDSLIVSKANDKYGILNHSLQQVTPIVFDNIIDENSQRKLIIVIEKGKYGLINFKGKTVFPTIYDKLEMLKGEPNDYLLATKNGLKGVINYNGDILIPLDYADLNEFTFSEDLIRFRRENEGFGFVNLNGKEILNSLKYDDCDGFHDGLAIVSLDGKYGYINTSGNEVIPLLFDRAESFFGGLANVMKGDKYGIIDTKGNTIAPFIYDQIGFFKEDLAMAKRDNKIIFIDSSGKEKFELPKEYNHALYYENGLCEVQSINGNTIKTGIINKQGKLIIQANNIFKLANGNFFSIEQKNPLNIRYLISDTQGKYLKNLNYDVVLYGQNYLTACKYTVPKTVIKKGLKIFEKEFAGNEISKSEESLILQLNASIRCGLLNSNGDEVIPVKYESISPFIEDLAVVKMNGKYGFINIQDEVIIPAVYNYASTFYNGIAEVKEENNYFLIDKKGNRLVTMKQPWGR